MDIFSRIALFVIPLSFFCIAFSMDESEDNTSSIASSYSSASSCSSFSSNSSRETSPNKQSINDIAAIIKSNFSADAFKMLKDGHLQEFDALVGEASCQIRAIAIVIIYRKMLEVGIDNLTESEKEFINLSYILTKIKGPAQKFDGDRRKLDHKKLSTQYSGHNLEKVAFLLQQQLAQLSVSFIQDLSKKFGSKEMQKALSHTVEDSKRFKRIHCGCYPSISFILQTLALNHYPIVIIIRSWNEPSIEKLKLAYFPKNGVYHRVKNVSELTAKEPLVVFAGYSNEIDIDQNALSEKFNKLGIFDIIMGTFAEHPQFTGDHRSEDVPYKSLDITQLLEEKRKHAVFAEENQCSLSHRDLFVTTHIYPSTIGIEFPQEP